jgi:hypothetical protein
VLLTGQDDPELLGLDRASKRVATSELSSSHGQGHDLQQHGFISGPSAGAARAYWHRRSLGHHQEVAAGEGNPLSPSAGPGSKCSQDGLVAPLIGLSARVKVFHRLDREQRLPCRLLTKSWRICSFTPCRYRSSHKFCRMRRDLRACGTNCVTCAEVAMKTSPNNFLPRRVTEATGTAYAQQRPPSKVYPAWPLPVLSDQHPEGVHVWNQT